MFGEKMDKSGYLIDIRAAGLDVFFLLTRSRARSIRKRRGNGSFNGLIGLDYYLGRCSIRFRFTLPLRHVLENVPLTLYPLMW